MRLILLILVFVSSIQLASTTASGGISTKRQDILKLIGTTYAPNGKFAWIEINGEVYGWTREGENVWKYRIVRVEIASRRFSMGQLRLNLLVIVLVGLSPVLSFGGAEELPPQL